MTEAHSLSVRSVRRGVGRAQEDEYGVGRQYVGGDGRSSGGGRRGGERRWGLARTVSLQQRIKCGLQMPDGGDPKDELSRLWKGLRDKHGEKFMAELKERLKK
jgi:hypothetical protein